MRYYTKEYYGKASISSMIPNCLTVISEDEYDFDTLMQRRLDEASISDASRMIMDAEREPIMALLKQKQEESGEFDAQLYFQFCMTRYSDKEAFRKQIEEFIQTPEFTIRQKNEGSIATRSYEYHMQLLDNFLDEDTKMQIRDIRVLALCFVTQHENDIMHTWRKAFKTESRRTANEYEMYYKTIECQLTDSVKNFMECDFFDLKCERKDFIQDGLILSYDEGDMFTFLFHNARNVVMDGQLDWFMAREMYINSDASYHLELLFKEGEISLDCSDITITDTRVWPDPEPGAVPLYILPEGVKPKPFRNTMILDDCKPGKPI